MKTRRFVICCILLVLLVASSGPANAEVTIQDFNVPTPDSRPWDITAGPDGHLWFTEYSGNKIGRINPVTGAILEFPIPTNNSGLAGIVLGADGSLWFAEADASKIGRMTTGGTVTEYSIPTNNAGPVRLARGTDGNVWFVEYYANKLGRITTDGIITEFPLPSAGGGPYAVTTGSDLNVWYTKFSGWIGRFNPSTGSITEFPVPTAGSNPMGITAGPDGNVWFTEGGTGKIGRITPDGIITEFVVPTASCPGCGGIQLTSITRGPDSNLWFTEMMNERVGYINPTTLHITELRVPSGCGAPNATSITAGPDGNLWYTGQFCNKVGRVNINLLTITTPSPLPSGIVGVPYSTTLQATGGTLPYRWSLASGQLPQGLNLNETTGEISGTPTAAGFFAFTIRVTDSSSVTMTKQFTLSPPPPAGTAGTSYQPTPIIITPPSTNGTPPTCMNYTLAPGSDPLPPGMSLNPTTGVLSGTPTDGGTYDLIVQCTYNTNLTATKDFALTIYNPVPALTLLTPASGVAGGPAFTLTIDGNGFVRDSTTRWNGMNRTTTYISPTRLRVEIMATDIQTPGTASITVVNPTPGGGTSNALSFNIVLPNRPPTANAGGPYSEREGGSVMLNGAGSDPDSDPITFAWDLNNDGTFETSGQTVTFVTGDRDGPANQIIVLRVCDNKQACGSSQATITIENAPPTATLIAPSTADEGSLFNVSLANPSDPSGADRTAGFTYAFDCGDGKGFSAPDRANTIQCKAIDNPGQTVQGKIFDKDGGSTPYTLSVTVNNVAPSIGPITAPTSPMKVNTVITTTANFTDPGVRDTHRASWDWNDGSTAAGNVTETSGSGSVTGAHTYTAAGVYTIKLTVTDKDGGQGQSIYQYVVVYDPSVGFVTGGGWINSPVGAYTLAPSLSGKATFGFVAKYQKGANTPSGQTEFEFHVANMNFHSTSYQWLVVGGLKAQYKGSGTINGSGDYGFLLTAIDGQQNGGGGVDKFRIKIWEKATDKIVYDNQMGATDDANPTTAIVGGSIVIHTQ